MSKTKAMPLRIATFAILTAVVFLLTFLVRIPVAPTKGYLNLGDVAIYFIAYAFGPFTAFIAGGLGTAITDLVAGYSQWAPISLFAHGLQGLFVGLLYKALAKKENAGATAVSLALGFLAGTVIMAGLYFLTAGFMYGFGAAVAEIPGNILQNVAGIVVGYPLALTIRRAFPPVTKYNW